MLVAEIDRTKIRGLDLKDKKFQVIIEHKEWNKLMDVMKSNNKNYTTELEKVVREEQSSIIEKLNYLHASENLKVLPFANAIYAELTFDQIIEVSKLNDVKIIRLNKTEHVTC